MKVFIFANPFCSMTKGNKPQNPALMYNNHNILGKTTAVNFIRIAFKGTDRLCKVDVEAVL